MDYVQTGNRSSELHQGTFDRSQRSPEPVPGKRTLTSSLVSGGKQPRAPEHEEAKRKAEGAGEGGRGGGAIDDPFALHLLGHDAGHDKEDAEGDAEDDAEDDGSVVFGGKAGMPPAGDGDADSGPSGGEIEAPAAEADEEGEEGEGEEDEEAAGKSSGVAAEPSEAPGEHGERNKVGERGEAHPAKSAGTQLRAAGATSALVTAARRQPRSHTYVVHLKAWIPHDHVVDPEGASAGRAADILQSVANPFPYGPKIKVRSKFRGDGHDGFRGGYRVKSKLQLRVQGGKIVNASDDGAAGVSHRDVEWEVYVKGPFGFRKTLKRGHFTETRTAKGKWSAGGSGNSFKLHIHSKNPLVRTFAPAISSDAAGTVSRKGLKLRYRTDQFPSHGVAVYKNGKALVTKVVRDASGVNANGPRGAGNVAIGLSQQTVKGEIKTK